MPGNLLVNILILGGSTLLVAVFLTAASDIRSGAFGHLITGFLAAATVLAVLLLLRRTVMIRPADAAQRMAWLAAVVAAEEAAKLGITGRLRTLRKSQQTGSTGTARRSENGSPLSAAALRGWGFAAAEHLLYSSVSPGAFLVRIVSAGAVHVGTSVWYALPQQPQRSAATVSLTRYLAAVGVHLLYNLTLTTLDSFGPIW